MKKGPYKSICKRIVFQSLPFFRGSRDIIRVFMWKKSLQCLLPIEFQAFSGWTSTINGIRHVVPKPFPSSGSMAWWTMVLPGTDVLTCLGVHQFALCTCALAKHLGKIWVFFEFCTPSCHSTSSNWKLHKQKEMFKLNQCCFPDAIYSNPKLHSFSPKKQQKKRQKKVCHWQRLVVGNPLYLGSS